MSAEQSPRSSDRRVCVWFGTHLIADFIGDPDAAVAHESAMRGRFLSLRITNEPATPPLSVVDRSSPHDGP